MLLKCTMRHTSGFTLIELSIVLVVIGLIIGGILTGQDLINVAAERAQIAQIEKYNTATRTFQNKYGFLPGDIPNPYATQFGFVSRGTTAGEGDGNGIIMGKGGSIAGVFQAAGETTMYWVDLSTAGLIDGGFTIGSPATLPGSAITGSALNSYFPSAKIGNGNFVNVDSGGWAGNDNTNYFTLTAIASVPTVDFNITNPGLTVKQAYDIDKKVDDGLPQSGGVLALNNGRYNGGVQSAYFTQIGSNFYSLFIWAAAASYSGASCGLAGSGNCNNANNGPTTSATSGSSLTCYDNGGLTGPQNYSIGQNGGGATNCALSFKFQ